LSGRHTRPLADLRADDTPRFGGKSTSLGELLHAEVPVPPGFALGTTAFDAFLAAAGLEDRVAEVLEHMDARDVGSVQAAAETVRAAVMATPVPEDVCAEIGAAYAALAAEVGGGDDVPVAVRSSAVGEDSVTATFAGQQETYLWVRGAEAVCDAVRDCWASGWSAPALSYRARLGDDPRPQMGVAIQLMVDATVSGVMFTCNPVSGDPSVIAVNASWGLGQGVVGGEVTPDEFLVSRVTREIVRRSIGTKHVEYRPAAGGGTERRPVAEERQGEPCLGEEQLAELVSVARVVQRHFGGHQDVEWAIGPDRVLYVVQSRPVTATGATAEEPEAAPVSALSLVMNRFGAGGAGG
jgi:pyruvate, water dikinase